MEPEPLITAALLEARFGIKRKDAYQLAKLKIIPSYRVGRRLKGIRFLGSEVLRALRRPAEEKHEPSKQDKTEPPAACRQKGNHE